MYRGILGKIVFLLCCTVLLSSGSVSALGANPVLSYLKTGDEVKLSSELILVFNNSNQVVNVTGWCVYYASSTDITKTKLACFDDVEAGVSLMLEPFGYIRLATADFTQTVEGFIPDKTFSAGISGTGGHIRLLDKNGQEIDKLGYGTAASPEGAPSAVAGLGYDLSRKLIPETLYRQDVNDNSKDFEPVILQTIPPSGLSELQNQVDVCQNIDGQQTEIPEAYFLDADENCVVAQTQAETRPIWITELLPNSNSVDSGNEYIELFNPNDSPVDIGGYKLELGPTFTKSHIFDNKILDPGGYFSFSDVLTDLVLPNSTASLRLISPTGEKVSETETYENPKDDKAWALIEGAWQYTSVLTPGAENVAEISLNTNTVNQDETLADCGPGKFRNPETNRCKSIATDDQELKPCISGQVRNPETNRCRSVAVSSSLVPCKAGQVRNPETNRCRSVVATASTLKACAAGQVRNPETNRCRKTATLGASTLSDVQDVPASSSSDNFNLLAVLGISSLVGGYAIYEWRTEILRYLGSLRGKLAS